MKLISAPIGIVSSGVGQAVRGLLLAVLSGLLLALALPPYDVPLLGFVALSPLLIAVFQSPRRVWMVYAPVMSLTACVLLTGLPFSAGAVEDYLAFVPFVVFGVSLVPIAMVARQFGTARGWMTVLATGIVAVLCEWLAARLDYPYTIALVLWRDVPLLWVAGWIGVWGLAFLVWSLNAAVALAVVQKGQLAPLKVLGVVLILLHGLGWLQMRFWSPDEYIRVAVVQARHQWYEGSIAEAKARGAQLIVLPEVCCDPARAAQWARQYQVWLVVGYWSARNSASLVAPDGSVSLPYYKMYPYLDEEPSWLPGEPIRAFASPFGVLGAVICYDTMFTEPCRQQARNGARLIAVPTFDPVVPNLALHHLHAAMTTLRAAEHRTPMARSEYAAASIIVDEWGRILAYADEHTNLAVADVPLGSGKGTLASRIGDWLMLGYAIGGLMLWQRAYRTGR